MNDLASNIGDEIISDPWEFNRRVGVINFAPKLRPLGFKTFSITGSFYESDIPELQEFCEQRPAYHIVSMTSSHWYINRYVPGSRIYRLANGDSNPQLRSHLYLHKGLKLFLEDGSQAALAVIAKINRCNDT